MDDEKIIELYWRRDETAIARTDEKYGRLCRKISDDILSSREDSEECVADTYLALWNCIPPQHPSRFRAFIAAVTRNLSLKRLRSRAGRHRDNRAGGRKRDLLRYVLTASFGHSSIVFIAVFHLISGCIP